jgi:alanine-glyoxylate transaminase/serine-glyoxylate transaminase/serine-pyruvate transaminase
MERAIAGGQTKLVAFVHAETSTGVLQPHAEIVRAAKAAGALVVVDCVTSLGGVPVAIDAWGVDAAYAGTQKCLGVPPGLSPVTFSAAALDRVAKRRTRCPSWYLDVQLLGTYWGGERVYHHTAPVNMVYALGAGLAQVLAEGLEERFARHRRIAAGFWRGLAVLGLECHVPEPLRLPQLTAIRVPDGVDELAARRSIREKHRIEIGGGLGPLKGRIWRVGLMGHGARTESVVRVLAAFGDVLAAAGRKADLAAALRAATS